MEKEIETGKLIHVAWIPTQYAKKDKVISIKMNEGWDDGWKVIEVGASKVDGDVLNTQRDAQKRWEKVLDHGVRE
jgi:hypothetical protein